MTHRLKYVFYFESFLMAITFVMATVLPDTFIAQIAPGVIPTELTRQLARWYGVPFLPLTLIQLHTLSSGNRYALRLVMLTYLLTDMTQMVVTLIFADSLGWSFGSYVSLATGLIFIGARAVCLVDLDRVGVRLAG